MIRKHLGSLASFFGKLAKYDKVFLGASIVAVNFCIPVREVSADIPREIEIVTEELPPLNYTENGELTGLATEVVRALLKEIGIRGHFRSLPWARSFRIAQSTGNVLIYSISRLPERESKFKWVGKISDRNNNIYCLSSANINLSSLEDAKKYKVGTTISDSIESYFIDNGFSVGVNLESIASNEGNYAKLKAGRIDLWPMNDIGMAYIVRKAGDDPNEMVRKLWKIDFDRPGDGNYMAFGAETSDEVVAVFRKGLEKIKANGVYAEIYRKWAN